MKRYFQIMKAYLRGSLMYQMEYKFNFLVGGTFELIWMVMYIIFINVAFLHTKDINGWNKYQMLMLTFQGGLMDSVFTFAVVPGLKRLPELINKGTLDFLLLKPVNKKFNISFNEFDIPQIKNIFINIFGVIYCIKKLQIVLTPTKILIYVCFNFPILYIVKGLNLYFIIYSFIATAICFMILNFIFKRGLRRYVSAGS